MIIKKVEIEKFRGIRNTTFNMGEILTIIAGQNGAMKSTLLGIISQPFSMRSKDEFAKQKTLDGYAFESKFSDKFKWSKKYDIPGEHKWKIFIENRDIYSKEYFEAISAPRKEGDKEEQIRIISTEGKKLGASYIKCPVIYLSLKRVVPLGEEHNEKLANILTEEESSFFIENHKHILSILDEIEDVSSFQSSNKRSLLANTSFYDYSVNSAGQDNIGKIISAILSFKRLKEAFPEEYKGGLLLIDEVDATLFPCAQKKLMEFLRAQGNKLGLQIIVTTHSYNILKQVKSKEFIYNTKILYLKKQGDNVICHEDPSLEEIEADLNIKVVEEVASDKKIRVYCEDAEAACFIENILTTKQRKAIQLMKKITFGCNNLLELTRKKVPEFCDNIIVLDGDTTSKNKNSNYCILPGNGKSPEHLMYTFLCKLREDDAFWGTELGAYDKQKCFRDYSVYPKDREDAKKWFNSQIPFWGNNGKKLFERWKGENLQLVEDFQLKFNKALEYCLSKSKCKK